MVVDTLMLGNTMSSTGNSGRIHMGALEPKDQKQTEALTMSEVRAYRDQFSSDPKKLLMQNVVTRHDVNQFAN